MKKFILLGIFAWLVFAGCLTTQSSTTSLTLYKEEGKYVHQGSGLSFPLAVVPTWKSYNIKQYDENGNNISVGYMLDGKEKYKKAVGTIFVYPALKEYAITPIPKFGTTPESYINNHFEEIKEAIIKNNHSVLLNEDVIYVDNGVGKVKGKKATLEYTAVNGEKVFDYAYLFVNDGWFIKYRFTFPSKYSKEVDPKILLLVEEISKINS